jgi:hypothetical protein
MLSNGSSASSPQLLEMLALEQYEPTHVHVHPHASTLVGADISFSKASSSKGAIRNPSAIIIVVSSMFLINCSVQ